MRPIRIREQSAILLNCYCFYYVLTGAIPTVQVSAMKVMFSFIGIDPTHAGTCFCNASLSCAILLAIQRDVGIDLQAAVIC